MAQEQGLLGGRYRLVVTVGRGGMGTVWRAHDEVLDRDVAIKEVLLPPGIGDADRRVLYERTFREARASARLSHPNVVTVHDVVEEDGRPWIVMEYVLARSLQDIIDQDGPTDPATAADIGRQTLLALRHAHAAGILHRDVKPSNVLITDEGRAVLTDFGIAQVEGDANLTQTGLVMGSPAYIPPERAKGERAVPASDLWALGATLYAAVEGKAPYERSDAIAALAASLTEPVPPPRNAGPLAGVLDGLLVREPDGRLTADEVLPLLTRITRGHGLPQTAPDPDPAPAEPISDRTRVDHESPWDGPTQVDRPRPAMGQPPVPAVAPVSSASAPADATWVAEGGPYGHVPQQDDYAGQWREARVEPAWERTGHLDQDRTVAGTAPKRSRTGRGVLIAVAVLLAVVAVSGGTLLVRSQLNKPQANGPVTGKGTVPQAGGTTPLAGNGKKSPAPGSPGTKPVSGVRPQKEQGFSVAVPAGWSREVKGKSVLWRSPDRSSLLQIDQTEWYGPARPQADKANSKGGENAAFPGYSSLGVTDVPYHGQPAAEWEFTFTDPDTAIRMRVVDRWVNIGGRPYAIYFRAPASQWSAARVKLDAVFASFHPSQPN